jgi:xanthine/CO dehydrogenase XdhC/CoxF family maturation factor
VRVRDDLALTFPAVKGGRPSVAVEPASDQLTAYVETLVKRAEAIRARRVETDEDNPFRCAAHPARQRASHERVPMHVRRNARPVSSSTSSGARAVSPG